MSNIQPDSKSRSGEKSKARIMQSRKDMLISRQVSIASQNLLMHQIPTATLSALNLVMSKGNNMLSSKQHSIATCWPGTLVTGSLNEVSKSQSLPTHKPTHRLNQINKNTLTALYSNPENVQLPQVNSSIGQLNTFMNATKVSLQTGKARKSFAKGNYFSFILL